MSENIIKDEKLNEFLKDKKCAHILNPYISGFMATINKNKKIMQNTMYLTLKYIDLFDKYMYYYHPSSKIKDINETHIEQYKFFCEHKLKNSHKTINSKLIALKKFFNYLTKSLNIYKFNFMLNVSYLQNEKENPPVVISVNNLKILFAKMREYRYGIRDICISKIILQTGLKIQDILNIEMNQISVSDKLLIINSTKGNTVYSLSSVLMKELTDYLEVRKSFDTNNSKYLFLSQRGNKYSIRSYQMFFDEAVQRCEFDIPYSPRNLRSTFLYRMSRLVSKNKLKEISSQDAVNQYYELSNNPLRDLI